MLRYERDVVSPVNLKASRREGRFIHYIPAKVDIDIAHGMKQ